MQAQIGRRSVSFRRRPILSTAYKFDRLPFRLLLNAK